MLRVHYTVLRQGIHGADQRRRTQEARSAVTFFDGQPNHTQRGCVRAIQEHENRNESSIFAKQEHFGSPYKGEDHKSKKTNFVAFGPNFSPEFKASLYVDKKSAVKAAS